MYFEAKRTVLIAIIDYSLELTREIKKIEIAKKLLEENIPKDKIIEITGLSIDELNSL